MKISLVTAIKRDHKNPERYEVYLDGGFAFTVYEDIIVQHNLLKGMRIADHQLEQILTDERRQQAYKESLRYISRRSRTSQEVRQLLKRKGYDGETIDPVIDRLTERNYLNDAMFAQTWAGRRISSSQYGRNRIQQELKEKGLKREDISTALEGIDAQEELKSAMRAAQKKWRTLAASDKKKSQKLLAFLLRRGFTQRTIRQVLQNLRTNMLDTDEEIDV